MIPVKEYVIVDFLSWIREFHPNIESLRVISDEKLRNLCREFLESGYIGSIDKILRDFRQWLYKRDGPKYFRRGHFDIHYLCEEFHEFMHEYEHRYRREYERYPFEEGEEISAEHLYDSVRSFLNGYIYEDLAVRLRTIEPQLFHFLIFSGQTEFSLFIDWMSRNHPEIDLLTNIPDEVLKNFITEFTKSHEQYRKFATGDAASLFQQLMKFKKGEYYKELFEELLKRNVNDKKRNRSYIEGVDLLKRYKTVPLHAIFLYSSQHSYVQDYIIKHWGALSSMSGDYCDIYFSTDQLDYEIDAFDVIEQIKAEVDISQLPGILFWESSISKKYFLSFEKLDKKVGFTPKDLTRLLLIVFQQIRVSPSIDSIKKGETLFYKEYEKEKASPIVPPPQVTINVNVKKLIGDVVGEVQGDFIKNMKNQQTLTDIFESLEWSEENRERVKSFEETLKYNAKAIEDVQLFIQKLVETNKSNTSFMEKLKDFACNLSSSISGSFIANAIWAVLASVKG